MSASEREELSQPPGEATFSEEQRAALEARRDLPAPAAKMAGLVPGSLYGTDGANLYLIDRATGAASLIGKHGLVAGNYIGAIAFDAAGVLYGISPSGPSPYGPYLYRIDVTNGAATPVGPLGIGPVWEDGLTFDATGRLIGVNEGNMNAARAFEIDPATGAATLIGPLNGQARDINGLTREGDVIYAIDRPSETLGRLDPVTGLYTVIGGTGVPIGATGGLAFREADGAIVFGGEPLGRERRHVQVRAHDSIVLPPNTATMDDCYRIAQLLYGGPPPQPLPLTIGYLEIISTSPLAVDAVYTVFGS